METDVAHPSAEPIKAAIVGDNVRSVLSRHRESRLATSSLQLITTLVLFVATWVLCLWSLQIGYWLTLLIALPASGLLMRLFILQHDCGHGSFFASQATSQIVGTGLGLLTLTPYQCWKRQHAIHHATTSQLDHRGIGDVTIYTVAEFLALSRWRQLKYRLYRHPLVFLGVGPLLYFGLIQRCTYMLPASWKRERRSVHLTNVMIVVSYIFLGWLVGPWVFVKIQVPIVALASSLGSWLFYIQHQFEPTFWEHDDDWDFNLAATHGSSFLDLPGPLRWLTANIGFHHIHHLDSRIPNYELQKCHRALPELPPVERLTLISSLRCLHLKLWDEESRRLISFREARPKIRGDRVRGRECMRR